MNTVTVNFLRVRNNIDFYRTFSLKTKSAPDAVPTPVDLGSALLFMAIRPSTGGAPVVTLSVGQGIEKIDAANGRISVLIDSAVMATIEPGKYKYDLVMVRSGLSETPFEGYMKIVGGVTPV